MGRRRAGSTFAHFTEEQQARACDALDEALAEKGVLLRMADVWAIAQRVLTAAAAPAMPSDAPDAEVITLHHRAQRTSRAAAERALPKVGSRKLAMLEYYLARGSQGATDAEVEIAFADVHGNPAKHQSISASRYDLVKSGWLADSNRERPNDVGNACIVWVVPEHIRGWAHAEIERAHSA